MRGFIYDTDFSTASFWVYQYANKYKSKFTVTNTAQSLGAYGIAQSQYSISDLIDLTSLSGGDTAISMIVIIMVSPSGSGWDRIKCTMKDVSGVTLCSSELLAGQL